MFDGDQPSSPRKFTALRRVFNAPNRRFATKLHGFAGRCNRLQSGK